MEQKIIQQIGQKNDILLLNSSQIYNKESQMTLSDAIQRIKDLEGENALLQDINKRLILIENELNQPEPSQYPSWNNATLEEIQTILTAYYNNEITLDDIPWKIGDKKVIPHQNLMYEHGNQYIVSNNIVLTILDMNHESLVTPINGHQYAAYSIGLSIEGSFTYSNLISWKSYLNLYTKTSTYFDYSKNQYLGDYGQTYWRLADNSSFWTTSVSDAETIMTFQNFFDNGTLNDIFSTIKKQVYFKSDFIYNQSRSLIPMPLEYVCNIYFMLGRTLKYFNNMDDLYKKDIAKLEHLWDWKNNSSSSHGPGTSYDGFLCLPYQCTLKSGLDGYPEYSRSYSEFSSSADYWSAYKMLIFAI